MMKGVDISRWQRGLNLSRLKDHDIEFVILKAGGSDDGFYQDSCFEDFYQQAKACGLHIGAYFIPGEDFLTEEAGRENARYFYSIISRFKFDMPVYVDIELQPLGHVREITDATIAFCETMEGYGYYTGIYSSEYAGFADRLDADRLTPYTWWVAHWGREPNIFHPMWQTSGGGLTIDGIEIDEDICFEDFPAIIGTTDTTVTAIRDTVQRLKDLVKELEKLVE